MFIMLITLHTKREPYQHMQLKSLRNIKCEWEFVRPEKYFRNEPHFQSAKIHAMRYRIERISQR